MNYLLTLPLVIPFSTAILALLFGKTKIIRRGIVLTGALALLATAGMIFHTVTTEGILVAQMGRWAAPFGITMVADHISAIMVLLAAIIGLCGVIYSFVDIDERRESFGFYSLLMLLLGAVSGAFLAGDLFNLYVWYELVLISSFSLLILGGEKAQIDGAIKYLAINLVATMMLLCGIVLLYGITGTLNMADLHLKVKEVQNPGLLTGISVMFIMAFGIKSAVFPLFFWLPSSYHTPPVAVSAIFSGLLTKVGIYSMIRMFTLVFTQDVGYTHQLLLIMAGFTMVTGVLGAAAHNEIRRILLFHIISQIGYLVMGIALFSPLAMTGTIYFLGHIIIVKTALILIGGVVNRRCGTMELASVGGFYQSTPFMAFLFFVCAFSLAGFPPLSGFWAKFALVRAGLAAGSFGIVATALAVGLMTAYSMTKIWGEAFWKPAPATASITPLSEETQTNRWLLFSPIIALTVLTVVMGFWAEPFMELSIKAANELFHPENYVRAVLEAVL
jgi:multicomponent Na+:H+ antiporter subunit D